MKVDDELLGLLREINQLDLPIPRRAHLQRLGIAAKTSAARQKVLSDARAEVARNRYRVHAHLVSIYENQRYYEEQAESREDAAQKPQATISAPKRYAERLPDPKPVTRRRMEPRKPMLEVATEPVLVEIQPIPEIGKAKHGTTTAYARGCRCDACREAKSVSRKGKGRARRANGEPAPHGTTTNYQRGCRCVECRKAVADYARWKRHQERSSEDI
ncbi:hypothetical protein LG322_08470 [Microbacterium aerolatum]|uniref:hypothetical protein n=1 Tax=Microbacterium aerolatum TaxID=153731 RepID=UPI00385109C1